MRPIYTGVTALAALAIVSTVLGTTVSAQEPRPRSERIGESIERTIEAFAELVEGNIERWAKDVERNAERWAAHIERNAERWAEDIERHAEDIAVIVETEIAGQDSDARERAREARERARETQREAQERARERREEAQERAREQREEARERAREAQERARENGRRSNRNWPEVTEPFSRTIRLSRGILNLDNISGDIVITGGSGSDVRIDAVKRVRTANDAEARTLLSELRVEVDERAGRIEVRTVYPQRVRQANFEVDYTVSLPSGVDVIVKSISGDVRLTNVRSEVRAETISGDLTVAGASRVQLAKTVSGDLQITDSNGDVNAAALSGDVTIRNVKGRTLNVELVSGDAVLTDVDVERLDVGTMNGEISFSGRVQKGGRYELSSHQGDIRFTPTGTANFDFEARTFSGSIESAYTVRVNPAQGFAPGGNNRSVRGTAGEGGAFVTIQSFNGDVTLVKK